MFAKRCWTPQYCTVDASANDLEAAGAPGTVFKTLKDALRATTADTVVIKGHHSEKLTQGLTWSGGKGVKRLQVEQRIDLDTSELKEKTLVVDGASLVLSGAFYVKGPLWVEAKEGLSCQGASFENAADEGHEFVFSSEGPTELSKTEVKGSPQSQTDLFILGEEVHVCDLRAEDLEKLFCTRAHDHPDSQKNQNFKCRLDQIHFPKGHPLYVEISDMQALTPWKVVAPSSDEKRHVELSIRRSEAFKSRCIVSHGGNLNIETDDPQHSANFWGREKWSTLVSGR